jgi:hypothetical protein
MELVGRLSNPELAALIQRLASRQWKQEAAPRRTSEMAPDGRRRFGTVRDAILQVLDQAGCELRVRDIHAGVDEILRGTVPASSVKDYLWKGCRRRPPLFEHRGRDGYRQHSAEGGGGESCESREGATLGALSFSSLTGDLLGATSDVAGVVAARTSSVRRLRPPSPSLRLPAQAAGHSPRRGHP